MRRQGKARELFLLGALSRGGAGFGIFGRPVFGRECDAPELRARGGKFEADFGSVAAHRAEENDVALLLLEGFLVLDANCRAAGDTRLKKHQRAMCANGEGFGLLVEGSALCVRAAKADRNLHQHALTAALGALL